jgi:hypothetical protein
MSFIYQGSLPGIPPEPRKSRGSSRDVLHAYMTKGVVIDQLSGMPVMKPETDIPAGAISFSEAISTNKPDFNSYVHFYENDDKVERFWNNPWRYMKKLSHFAGFIATDYSTGPGIPDPVRRYNVYRNQLTGAWLQSLGFHALCNMRCPAFGHDYFIAGAPHNSLIGIGEVGCVKNRYDRNRFEGGLIRAINELAPAGLVIVGSDFYGVFDYARDCGVPLYFYAGQTSRYRKDAANV